MKKWFVATIVAAALLIPTGAYAGYNYLADSIYGSSDNLIQIGGTQQKYDELEAKLQQAKASLSEKNFTEFTSLLKEIGRFNLEIAAADGVLHPELLSSTDQKRYELLTAQLAPYFKQLKVETPGKIAETGDNNAFWDQMIAKAEQELSGDEFAEVRQLIGELKSYEAKATAQEHSVQLSEDELAQYEQLLEQLNPYLQKLGVKLKPAHK